MTNDSSTAGGPNGTGVMCPVATVDVKTRRRLDLHGLRDRQVVQALRDG